MSAFPFRVDIPEPHPEATVRLPKNSGSVKGRFIALEARSREDLWALVDTSTWVRWSTQIFVGQPAMEGIGPATAEMWAPARAVDLDEDDLTRIKEIANAKFRELGAA